MAQVTPNTTIQEYQDFVREVYSVPNDRYYDTSNMLTNIQRFVMRWIKGIRKNDNNKITHNLLIAQSWFMSLMNQLWAMSKLCVILLLSFFLIPLIQRMTKRWMFVNILLVS